MLPIELISFSAKPYEDKIILEWQTASEVNNDYFTIEKYAPPLPPQGGSFEWEEIGIVKGAVNSSTIKKYSTIDTEPYTGVSYYRLKQTDFNGQFEYFNPVAVSCDETENNITVYPNPSSDGNFSIQLPENFTGKTTIKIYNTLGLKVYAAEKEISPGGKIISIDAANLPEGIYFLKMFSEGKIYRTKIVIHQ